MPGTNIRTRAVASSRLLPEINKLVRTRQFQESGFAFMYAQGASDLSFLVFKLNEASLENPWGIIQLDLPVRRGEHLRNVYANLHEQPYLLRQLIIQQVCPTVLADFLENVEGLSDSINAFVDCVTWLDYLQKNTQYESSAYKNWWAYVTRPVIASVSDEETFHLLVRYGANLTEIFRFSHSQSRLLLADFLGEQPQVDLFSLREKLAEKSVYRKLVGRSKREERVLFWDSANQAVLLREEKEISITLKEGVSREAIWLANPEMQRVRSVVAPVGDDRFSQLSPSGLLDFMLADKVYDTSYNPAHGYLTIWFTLAEFDGNGYPRQIEVPARLPFSLAGDNVIASVTHQRITVTDPLKIALFFLHGYDYLSYQRPFQLVHITICRKQYSILRYLIKQGVDLLAADPASSLQPAMSMMLRMAPPEELQFYLKKVPHRATEFFALCLQHQYYSTARKVLMKTRQALPVAALCDTKLLDVERLLMTEAKDSVSKLEAGSLANTASPMVYSAELLPDTARCAWSYKIFRLMLQFCPELVVAFVARKERIDAFSDKIRVFLMEAIQKSDVMMLEFLIGPEVALNWPAILTPDHMEALADACAKKKVLRKLAYQYFAEWYRKKPVVLDKKALPAPVIVSPEACQVLQQELSACLALCQRGWQTWCRQHEALPDCVSIMSGGVGMLSKDIDAQSLPAFLIDLPVWKKQRPYVLMTFPAWHTWLASGHTWLELYGLLQKQVAAMSLACVYEEAYQNSVKAHKRYQQKIQQLQEAVVQAGCDFEAYALKQLERQQNDSLKQVAGKLSSTTLEVCDVIDEILVSDPGQKSKKSGVKERAVSSVDSLDGELSLQVPDKQRHKKTYVRLLRAFFLTELPYVPANMQSIAINRFLVLLKDIQDRYWEDNGQLVVHPTLLPTLRNMYVHAGYFLPDSVIDTLIGSLREIGVALDKEESSLHDIKQSVYHFLCQAYRLALDSWGETIYETDLKTDGLNDRRKAYLYALYAQRPVGDRVARCRQIVSDRSYALHSQEDSSPENQIAWLYAMVEIGEHCKADVLKFLPACGQSYLNRSLRAFQLLRGDLYHAFLSEVMPAGDDPLVSNIFEKTGALVHSDAVVDLFAHAPDNVLALGGDEGHASEGSSLSTSLAQHAFFQNQGVHEGGKVSSQLSP